MREDKQSVLKSKIAALDSIIIKPKIAFAKTSANELNELRTEKERLYNIARTIQSNSGISESDTQELEYLNFQVSNYSTGGFVENIQSESLKFNFEQLKAILSTTDCQLFSNLSFAEYQTMYKTQPEKIKECFAKYRNTLLDTLEYNNLSSQDKKLLSDYISKKEVTRSYSNEKQLPHNNTNGYDTNYNNNEAFSLFDHSHNNNVIVDINSLNAGQPVDNGKIKKLLMFNDFRLYVKNKEISDDQIDNYFCGGTDIALAAENYFRSVNNSEMISLTYIFPNQKTQNYQFKFTSSPDDLILQVYKDHSDINDPYITLSNGREFSFNPIEDKYIGSLFSNGTVLYVRSR